MFKKCTLAIIYTVIIAIISALVTSWYYNNFVLPVSDSDSVSSLTETQESKVKASPLQDSQSIVEVMSYGCHYCAISEKEIKALDERLPAGVKVTRIHLTNQDNSGLAIYAPIFATLEVMGIEGKYTEIIYNDILKNNVDLSDEKTLDNWLVKNSIDVTAYKSVRQSQEVKDKLKFMLDVSQNYNIKATPAFIINKKWVSLQDRDYPEYSDNIISLLKTDKPLSK